MIFPCKVCEWLANDCSVVGHVCAWMSGDVDLDLSLPGGILPEAGGKDLQDTSEADGEEKTASSAGDAEAGS